MSAHPLASVAVRRDRIVAAVTAAYRPPVDGPVLASIVDAVIEVLPKGVRYSAVYKSLGYLLGTETPNQKTLRESAWSLAANSTSLKADDPVWPPRIPRTPAVVTMQFVAAARLPERGKLSSGFPIRYRLRVLQGPGTTLEIDTRLSSRFVSYLSCKPEGLGFLRPVRGNRLPGKERPYQHYETLVGMLVRADLSVDEDGKTKIDNLRCSSSMVAYNRSLTEMRWRATFQCPFNYEHPCHQCPKGQSTCRIATHPVDYVNRLCPQCLENSEFDPYWGDSVCRKCALKPKRKGDK